MTSKNIDPAISLVAAGRGRGRKRTDPDGRARLAVGIPAVAAHGFLGRCVQSVLAQEDAAPDILLVRNGRAVDLVCRYWQAQGLAVHRPRHNLGVAGAWNAACRWAWARGHDAILLLNDDMELAEPAILARFREAVDAEPRGLYFLTGRGFGAACISRVVWDELGPFDEGFWPAYHEDNDMHRRAALAGIPWRDVPGRSEHLGSAAIRTDRRLVALNLQTFPLTQQRYVAKWGGLPGYERFVRPFDGGTALPSVREAAVPAASEPATERATGSMRARARIPPPSIRPRMLVVVGVHNGFEILADSLGRLVEATDEADVLLIDNGSDRSLRDERWLPTRVRVHRNEANVGTYPVFAQALARGRGWDLLAILHTDLWIHEPGWDARVRAAFATDERLGLLGFVGSDEIDSSGGRGQGTMLNFSGVGMATPAEDHGRRIGDLRPAAVVDGCAMILRRDALEDVGIRPDFPPHHFYDRLISCQLLERGWHIGVLGVACDHLGNQTAGRQPGWPALAEAWAREHGIPAHNGGWDAAVFFEAERQFLTEWRDRKRFIPVRVLPDGSVQHTSQPGPLAIVTDPLRTHRQSH
jgi:GT2 family glycosyltransferase